MPQNSDSQSEQPITNQPIPPPSLDDQVPESKPEEGIEPPLNMLLYSPPLINSAPVRQRSSVDPRNRFTWANFFLLLSIPAVGMLVMGGALLIYNPLLFAWFYAPRSPIVYGSLWSPPKSLRQIRAELEERQMAIGDTLKLDSGEQIYVIIEKGTKSVQELRLYQSVTDGGVEKFISLQSLYVSGLDEAFVRSVRLQYAVKSPALGRKPWMMTKIEALRGVPPQKLPGKLYWFTITGTQDKIRYGQVFYFTTLPRPKIVSSVEWSSPIGQLPEWKNVLPSKSSTPQLLVNQTHNYEPLFAIFQPELDAANQNQVSLRRITLNEANISAKSSAQSVLENSKNPEPKDDRSNINDDLGNQTSKPAKGNLAANSQIDKSPDKPPTRTVNWLPNTPYQQALWLASVGLWQNAQQKMSAYADTLPQQKLPPYIQEQADLIAFHAHLTRKQAEQERSHIGDQALTLIMDGQWEAALVLLREKRSQGGKFAEMLTRDYPHIWQRIEVALALEPVPAVKIWGGMVILHRDGLRAAERWLKEQKAYTPEAMELLQRLDLAPIALKPEQIFGRVTYLGKEKPDPDWFLPPSALEANQGWYEVTVDVVKDGDVWRNAPLPMLADRSGLLLWRLFGFDRNNKLSVFFKDEDGDSRTAFLTIHSLYVNSSGELRLLTAADANIARFLPKTALPPLVSNRGGVPEPDGAPLYVHHLSINVAMVIVRSLYTELSRRGQISVGLEDFVAKAQQWQFIKVDFRGNGVPYLLLQLARSQVDLGERAYPITLIYHPDGTLIFSDVVNTERIWLGLLPSKVSGQSLTFSNGRYDVWVVR